MVDLASGPILPKALAAELAPRSISVPRRGDLHVSFTVVPGTRLVKRLSHILNLAAFMGRREPIAGPAKVGWDVTYRCDSRCMSCRRWEESPGAELSS